MNEDLFLKPRSEYTLKIASETNKFTVNTILSPLLIHTLNKKPTYLNKNALKSKLTVETPNRKRRSEICKSVAGAKGYCKRRKRLITNNYSYHLESVTSPKSKKLFRLRHSKLGKLPLLRAKSAKKSRKSKSKSKK